MVVAMVFVFVATAPLHAESHDSSAAMEYVANDRDCGYDDCDRGCEKKCCKKDRCCCNGGVLYAVTAPIRWVGSTITGCCW